MMTLKIFFKNGFVAILLIALVSCASKKEKDKAVLTDAGKKVEIEENWSALVGCKLLKEIKTYAFDSETALVQLRNDAAILGAFAITDIEWGRVEKDGQRMLLGKAEAYKCQGKMAQ